MIDQCISCQSPLGSETKDAEIILCHKCRLCKSCNRDLSKPEIDFCHDHGYPFKHARCFVIGDTGTEPLPIDHEVQLMNLFRLLLPDSNISETANELKGESAIERIVLVKDMNLEQTFLFMRILQSGAARLSLLTKKDAAAIKDEMAKKAKRQFDEAKRDALVSSSPRKLPTDNSEESQDIRSYEIALGEFMKLNNITERKIGLKKWKERQKAIDSFVALGLNKDEALKMVDAKRMQVN